MPVCPKCGSQIAAGAKYCAACGAAIESSGKEVSTTPSPAPGTTAGSDSGLAPNVAAMLTYIPLCLIGLVCAILFGFALAPYNKDQFVRFHAWQSLAVHGALLVVGVGWMICSGILTAILHVLVFITVPISVLIGLGGLALMIVLMIKAYGNQAFKVPVLGDWAEKQAKG